MIRTIMHVYPLPYDRHYTHRHMAFQSLVILYGRILALQVPVVTVEPKLSMAYPTLLLLAYLG